MFNTEKEVVPDAIWEGNQRLYWIITRGVSIASVVIGFHYLHPFVVALIPFIEVSTVGQVEATGIFASTLLTFALLAVYRDMGKTQSIQAQTQQNQETLIEMERRPYVEVVGYDFDDEPHTVVISNFGRGVALDLRLVTKVHFPEQEGLEPGVCVNPISRLNLTDMNRQDRSIPPQREEVSFEAKACIGLTLDDGDEGMPIRHGMVKLLKNDVETVTFQLYIQYWNILGETGLAKMTPPRAIHLNQWGPDWQVYDLQDMIEKSESIRILSQDIEFDELTADEMVDQKSGAAAEPNIIQSE